MERLFQPGKGATCALGDNLSPENVLVGSLAPFGLGVGMITSFCQTIFSQSSETHACIALNQTGDGRSCGLRGSTHPTAEWIANQRAQAFGWKRFSSLGNSPRSAPAS